MIFDALVVGYVRSNGLRALVSIVAIALGVATALTLSLASMFAVTTLDADQTLFAHHLDFQIAPYRGGVPQSVLGQIRYLDGIDSALPIFDRPAVAGVDDRGAGGSSARVIGTDILQPLPGVTGFEEGLPGPYAAVGTFIDPAAVIGTNGAILTTPFAKRLNLKRGDAFRLLASADVVAMRVANILPPEANGVDSSTVFVDVTTAQRIFGPANAFDRIDIVTGNARESVRSALLAAIGNRARLVDPEADAASLANLTAGVDVTFGTLAAIALAIGGLLVFNAIGTSIVQRRSDIGTLRALGVAPHQIAAAFATEGAGYGAIGASLGIGLGVQATQMLARITHAASADIAADPWPIVRIWFLGVAIATFCAILPALAASGVAPALAARQGAFERGRPAWRTVGFGAVGLASIGGAIYLGFHPRSDALFAFGMPLGFAAGGSALIPGLLRVLSIVARRSTGDAPPAVRLATSIFGAAPQRIGVALAALAIAVFAAVAFDIDSESFETALSAWANGALSGDLIVKPEGANGSTAVSFDRSIAVRAKATPGVRRVAAIRTLHVRSGESDVALRGDDDYALDRRAPDVLRTPPPAELSSQLASRLHLKPGDAFEVSAPNGPLHLRVANIRPDFSDGRGAIVVARSVITESYGDERIDSLRITVDARRDPTTVRAAISKTLAPLRLAISTTRELRERLIGVFSGTFGFARALGNVVVAIAVLGIVSALAALVFERRFELRMLRRLGTSRRTIARMLLLEAFALAVAGATLGSFLGLVLATVVLGGSDLATLGFAIPLDVPFVSIVVTLLASIAGATLGTTFSLPAAARIETDGRSEAS